MNKITIDLHGDYNVYIGQNLNAGDVIGTVNGWPNFAPHRHFSVVEVDDDKRFLLDTGAAGETYSYLYSRPGSFNCLNPITETPD